jgi:hypothetical protein
MGEVNFGHINATSNYPDVSTISGYRLISYYLMSSFLYYKKDTAVLTDPDYDTMCKRILAEWKDIKHQHKRKVNRKALEAGTGYQIKSYPLITQSAAIGWLSDWEKEQSQLQKK